MVCPRNSWEGTDNLEGQLRRLHHERQSIVEQIDNLAATRARLEAFVRAAHDEPGARASSLIPRLAAQRTTNAVMPVAAPDVAELRRARRHIYAAEQRQHELRNQLRGIINQLSEAETGLGDHVPLWHSDEQSNLQMRGEPWPPPGRSLFKGGCNLPQPYPRQSPEMGMGRKAGNTLGTSEDVDAEFVHRATAAAVSNAPAAPSESGKIVDPHAESLAPTVSSPEPASSSNPGKNHTGTSSSKSQSLCGPGSHHNQYSPRSCFDSKSCDGHRRERQRWRDDDEYDAMLDSHSKTSSSGGSVDLSQNFADLPTEKVLFEVAKGAVSPKRRQTREERSHRKASAHALRARWIRKWLGSNELYELIATTAELDGIRRLEAYRFSERERAPDSFRGVELPPFNSRRL